MSFVSLTRLRIRSFRFLPFFAVHTLRSIAQIKQAPGFLTGSLLRDRKWTFWTMTVWDRQESMRHYMTTGPHLLHWCDEASVAHWEQDAEALPSWQHADGRMRGTGRASKVRHPSPQHAALAYQQPRTSQAVPILKSGR